MSQVNRRKFMTRAAQVGEMCARTQSLTQIVRLHGDLLLSRNVRGLDVYLMARTDGEVVVGATVEERGFDPDGIERHDFENRLAGMDFFPSGFLDFNDRA